MAKMVRKPMKVAMSARPLMVSMKPLPTPHRTETKKSGANQAEGAGFGHSDCKGSDRNPAAENVIAGRQSNGMIAAYRRSTRRKHA